MKLNEKIIEAIENNGFCYSAVVEQDNGFYIELYQDTPAGEDWHVAIWFNGSNNGFINSFRRYSESFDVDEEAAIWIESRGGCERGIPKSIRVFVDDAEWKEERLQTLLKDLEDLDLEDIEYANFNEKLFTLIILDNIDCDEPASVFMIPLIKQIEVEKLAKTIHATSTDKIEDEFEDLLRENRIKHEWIGRIYDANRETDWIDDKISRVIVG